MIDYLPYFSGFVTLMFGVAFYYGLQGFKKLEDKQKNTD
jgi:hypothetical protein